MLDLLTPAPVPAPSFQLIVDPDLEPPGRRLIPADAVADDERGAPVGGPDMEVLQGWGLD